MKNLAGPMTPAAPVAADVSDGPVAFATDHLRAIKYPNRLGDVAVVGRLRDWHRSFLVRPRFGGRFVLLLHPRNVLDRESVIWQEFTVQSFNSSPVLLDVTIPARLRLFDTWEWRVVKTSGANAQEDAFEELDALEVGDGLLTGTSSARLARRALADSALSTLVFDVRPVMTGEVTFDEERAGGGSKLAVWSCHLPYADRDGQATVKDSAWQIMEWYRRRMEQFSPHRIWMLGDSVYSDATGALDFVKQVYNQAGW